MPPLALCSFVYGLKTLKPYRFLLSNHACLVYDNYIKIFTFHNLYTAFVSHKSIVYSMKIL